MHLYAKNAVWSIRPWHHLLVSRVFSGFQAIQIHRERRPVNTSELLVLKTDVLCMRLS